MPAISAERFANLEANERGFLLQKKRRPWGKMSRLTLWGRFVLPSDFFHRPGLDSAALSLSHPNKENSPMHFPKRILIAAAATAAMVVSAGPAMAHINGSTMHMLVPDAHNYSGSWPVTVSHSQNSNGTDCLTLIGSGIDAGSASVVIGSQKFSNGSFLVINHTLVATIPVQGYGQNAGLVFIGSADGGKIGPGVFEDVYGGVDFDSGALAFGMKGGC
jgi:hypothetical protein